MHPKNLIVCLFIVGCGSPATPNGTVISTKSDFEQSAGTPKETTSKISLDGGDTVLEVKITAVGHTISAVDITVLESGGWEVYEGGYGSPVNMGTIEKPMMEIPILINRNKKEACSNHGRGEQLRVRSDGSVQLEKS